jgi:hypothetical protein
MRHIYARAGRAACALILAVALSWAGEVSGQQTKPSALRGGSPGRAAAKGGGDTLGESAQGGAVEGAQNELRCRGGSALRIVMETGRRTPATNEQLMNMSVYFSRGTRPADLAGGNLEPGQCAWPDRGVDPGEPAEIHQEIIYSGQEKQALHGDPVDHSPTAAERHPDSLNVPAYLNDSNHYWKFFVVLVQTPAGRYFRATYGRYWKPAKGNVQILKTQPADRKATGDRRVTTSSDGTDAGGAGPPQPTPPCEKCPKAPTAGRVGKRPMR